MTLRSMATCRIWSAGLALSGLIVAGPGDAVADPDWTGFYVGAFAGGAWGNTDLRTDTGTVNSTTYFVSNANAGSVSSNASGSSSSAAFAGGVQFGANQRIDQIIVGAEVDYGSFNLSGGRGATAVTYPTSSPATYTVESSVGTDWLFTARGRLGWLASPRTLLYLTGGLALTELNVSNSFSDTAGSLGIGSSSSSKTKVGWTIGGGLEWAAGGPWTIKGEYLYVDLGSTSTSATIVCTAPGVCAAGVSSPFDTSAALTASIARLGVNYGF
jgi:outer membrane immunogenic protein